jgi:hypothetical protein
LFSAGFSGTAYTEYWKIWIDYNQNGTFETSEEMVSGSSSSSANLTSTFTVAYLSFRSNSYESVNEIQWHKLHVRLSLMEKLKTTLLILVAAATTSITTAKVIDLGNEDSISDVVMYPNPADNILNVRMADSRKGTYRLINFLGQQVDAGKLSESGINVSKLGAGFIS